MFARGYASGPVEQSGKLKNFTQKAEYKFAADLITKQCKLLLIAGRHPYKLSPVSLELSDFFELAAVLLLVMLFVGIEVDHAHGLPVARGAAPALGIGGLGRFIDVRAL